MGTFFLICATMVQGIPGTSNAVATPTPSCVVATTDESAAIFDFAKSIGAALAPNAAAGKSQVVKGQ